MIWGVLSGQWQCPVFGEILPVMLKIRIEVTGRLPIYGSVRFQDCARHRTWADISGQTIAAGTYFGARFMRLNQQIRLKLARSDRLFRQVGVGADLRTACRASGTCLWVRPATLGLVVLAGSLLSFGCLVTHPPCVPEDDMDFYRTVANNTQPTFEGEITSGRHPLSTESPLVIDESAPPPAWDMTLDEVIRLGLENSKVLRDLGGSVLRTPALAQTIRDPAIQATDARFGMDGALAAFDAQLSTRMFAQHNDRAFNNLFLGGGTFLFNQDLDNFDTELSKTTASGGTFAVRQHLDYDDNNAPANLFRSSWNVNYETEFRQPLLQGAGTEFNRIAGPRSSPGQINGVVIARLNNDVSTADFEIALRDYVSNLENAYWDLYYAYRDLDAKIAARDTALNTWRIIHANVQEGRGYSKLQEVQALEQYYRFQEDVLDALGGRLVERTRTNNGSMGGTFRGIGGVHATERRLRMFMGIPINDGKLIRPSDKPPEAKISFDWCAIAEEALARRPELRRQQSMVERANMELVANRNFLLPRLDLTGRYRWRGFGHDLIAPADPANSFDNAYANLTSGQFQEWELGFMYSMTVGFRREHAAVRNSQMRVARERAILEEQQRQTIHDLADAYADAERAYLHMQAAYNRLSAAEDQFRRANDAFFELGGKVSLELVLDARIRLADAETGYHRARIEYAVALKNVHFEKGSILEHNGAFLADGGNWRPTAPIIAQNKQLIEKPVDLNYVMKQRKSGPAALATSKDAPEQSDPHSRMAPVSFAEPRAPTTSKPTGGAQSSRSSNPNEALPSDAGTLNLAPPAPLERTAPAAIVIPPQTSPLNSAPAGFPEPGSQGTAPTPPLDATPALLTPQAVDDVEAEASP
jgi:hypothetical protein